MAAVTELSRIKIEDLEACKTALNSYSDPVAKFKVFDDLTNRAFTSTAFSVLRRLAEGPSFNYDLNLSKVAQWPTHALYVPTVLDAIDNCKKLSDHMLAALGPEGKNRLWSTCPQPDTYIHNKIFLVLKRIATSNNFPDIGNPKHPLYPIYEEFWKVQAYNYGNLSPDYDIEALVKGNRVVPYSLPTATTRITVKYDAGFGNKLFIRGQGPGLSWNKGIELKNTGGDTWVFETDNDFSNLQYKIVLNDRDTGYEKGDNRKIDCHKKEEIRPNF